MIVASVTTVYEDVTPETLMLAFEVDQSVDELSEPMYEPRPMT